MKPLYLLAVFILFFVGINVLGALGIHVEFTTAPIWHKILPSTYLILIVFAFYLAKYGFRSHAEEKNLFILFFCMLVLLLIRGAGGYIGVLNCFIMPVAFSYTTSIVIKRYPSVKKKLRRIVLMFFLIECSLAIIEKILGINVFPFLGTNETTGYVNEINDSCNDYGYSKPSMNMVEQPVPYGYSSTPENTYNATVGFEWKGFSCFVQFYGVTNVTRDVTLTNFADKLDNVYKQGSWWSKDNPTADVTTSRWTSTPSYNDATRYYYDGSYIRLKNAEIALKRAMFSLASYLNFEKNEEIRLRLPSRPRDLHISVEEALTLARENNPEFLEMKQSILEAEQEVDRTKPIIVERSSDGLMFRN